MSPTATIFDLKRFALHDGPGIRTTVFFSGCPLNCAWCHNPEARIEVTPQDCVRGGGPGFLWRRRLADRVIHREVAVAELMEDLLKDRVFYEESSGGVTFSGGEPMKQIEFLKALGAECRRAGLHVAVDTCGHAPWDDFEGLLDSTDLFLYDLKVMDPRSHERYTGVTNDLILANLRNLAAHGADVTLRVALIPGISDTDDNLGAVVELARSITSINTVCLLPYNTMGEAKYRRYHVKRQLDHLDRQTEEHIRACADKMLASGCTVRIGG